MAYFKIPKEIPKNEISGNDDSGEAVNEAEDRIMKRVKLFFQTKRPDLNSRDKKDDALKDDVV